MALPNDRRLCNGIPIDHRLERFLPNAMQKHSGGVGKHAKIVEAFGNTMIRDDGTTPSKHEAGFAAWLAKPDSTGGLVIALQQPAKSQVFTADVEWVRDECDTLAYLDKSLTFVNGPGGLRTTSVFDAFPFITEHISSKELSDEATRAYHTFESMIAAKRPQVLFACWRIHGRKDLSFSGKGVGKTKEIRSLTLPNGHVVRVVNGFHPSYMAHYCPNESCFRRLFAIELCKALCDLHSTWKEEDWMDDLRRRCQKRTSQLMKENGRDGEQLNTEPGRQLRSTCSKANNTAKKYEAYRQSFDNGLKVLKQIFDHMVSSVYTYQNSWDLYKFFVFDQNTSEGICDALLAVSEAMGQFARTISMRESAAVELSKHISLQLFSFVKDDIPDLVRYPRGLHKNLWKSRYMESTSQGLKQSIERITMRFFEDLTKSFSEPSTGWTYDPTILQGAFTELAVSFEDALGREYDDHQQTAAAYTANDEANLSASFNMLSISSSQPRTPTPPTNTTPSSYSSSDKCFKCGQQGHWSSWCPYPSKKGTTPSKFSSNKSCYNCGNGGHWASNCPTPQKGRITPQRPSMSSPSWDCYTYGEPSHSSSSFPSPNTTPSRKLSSDKCFKCGQIGHWSTDCPSRRHVSATPSSHTSRDKCFTCGAVGHWSTNCQTRRNR